ncbi:hypothetical protein CfE428DRAFT_3804 [Chthoniobacter flavus Ellin428]|uniref:Uncharacterized protein n=1 Tax=Chthoniobacter flavus Ellin428 TaxID=497964 RepID=B4D4G6_9BACT|nr:hypothetical protein [Chthoniobacter flavus]EDY18767.1 hypothetical protein CfE428DRAFT_3804 [Chthoniobacter flavus Ellin428]TCO88995.1 hypothetical protein EV701_11523 [Chthoniobacter flavus]
MTSFLRALPVWLVLGGVSWLLATAAGGDLTDPITVGALTAVLLLAAWLTAISGSDDLESRFGKAFAATITVLVWFATSVIAQGRIEAHPEETPKLRVSFGVAALLATGVVIKTRSYPRWATLRGIGITLAVPAVLIGIFLGCYELKTKSIAARAEARWNEIGLPMADIEKTFVADRENGGSEVLRKILREEIGTRYYKDGTPAAAQEPEIGNAKGPTALVDEAVKSLREYPPTDDLDLSLQTVSRLQSMAPTMDACYRKILAAEPPTWSTDLHDGYQLSVPNFLGVRKFAQVAAADALRRLSNGDQEGATRAINAGLRVADGIRRNPTLVSLMIGIAVDALLSEKQVRLPASSENGFAAIAQDTEFYRAALLRSMQVEAWGLLRFSFQTSNVLADDPQSRMAFLPRWIRRMAAQPLAYRRSAVAALNDAEHAAILKSPETITRPDLGASLHEAISQANPSELECNIVRAAMRIHATLLLREQTELIREARARLAEGRPLETRQSVVFPQLHWELTTDAEKSSVSTRLVNAPEWIVKGEVAPKAFWTIPVDGSVAWKFHQPAQTTQQ